MNAITSFLVSACVLAGFAIRQWVSGYLGLMFSGAAVIIAFQNSPTATTRSR